MEDDSDYHHGQGVPEVGKISSSSREDPFAGRDCVADAPVAPDEEEEEEEEGFTFAGVRGLGCGSVFSGGRIGPVYPVFGRPRSPPLQREVDERHTATARVPLGQLLLEERAFPSSGQQPDEDDEDDKNEDGDELHGVPAETYCLWSPGSTSPAASPARCQKSGSTGSVLRWRQRLIGRSHSDGKEKFVFLDAARPSATPPKGTTGGAGRAWSYYGRGGGGGRGSRSSTTTTTPSFLPYKQDLVGFFTNASAFRRSYHPF